MCGLGVILRRGAAGAAAAPGIPEDRLDDLEARLARRGPDGRGRWRHRGTDAAGRPYEVALVHRRLAIIDPADGGQPMVLETPEGPIAVAFNGCLYDHRARRAELEAQGHAFRTDHSDTEVLLHGHRAWGDALARRVEGLFAWAIVDGRDGSLHLARDPFGEKPLWSATIAGPDGDETVLAASDPLAVAELAARFEGKCKGTCEGTCDGETAPDRRPGHAWLDAYLQTGFGPTDGAPWPEVTAVAIGGIPGPTREDLRRERPARLHLDPSFDPVAAIESALAAAVEARLEADVPLGCFLSGGTDSSLIAAFARRALGRLETFCVRMPDPRHDESAHAAAVARHLDCTHRVLDVPVEDGAVARDLALLVRAMGRPFADSSLLAAWWVARAAGRHVKVALSGDGGDELFLGYDRHARAAPVAGLAPLLARLPAGLLRRSHRRSRRFRLARAIETARARRRLGAAAGLELAPPDLRARLVPGGGADDPAGLRTAADAEGLDPVRAAQRADLRIYLPFDLLAKTDAASMAVPLEVRCPFLDRELVALALGLPPGLSLRGGRKGLLREIARRHVPASAIDRPKQGFSIPLARWFREDGPGLRPMLAGHLADETAVREAGLDPAAVRGLVREHERGGIDRAEILFAVLSLLEWRAAGDEPASVPSDPSGT